MKKILFKIMLLTLPTSSLVAFDFGDFNLDLDQNIDGCLDGIKFNGADSICGAVNNFDSVLNGKFNVGGCSIGFGISADCFSNGLNNRCQGLINSNIYHPMNGVITSSNKFDFLKGEAFQKDDCRKRKDVKNHRYPSGETDESIAQKTSMRQMARSYGFFSSQIDNVRDCMKVSGEKCLEPDYQKLPENSIETQKNIDEAAQNIAVADETISSNIATVQAEISQKVKACKGTENEADCITKITSDEASPQALATKEIAKVEMASALELEVMEKAARGSSYYVFRDKESIEALPIEVRIEYADGVRRQNAADTLIRSLYKEITDIKKDSINASYGSITVQSSVYDAQNSVNAIQLELNTTEALQKAKTEGQQ